MDIEQIWQQLDTVAVQLFGSSRQALIEALAENRRLMGIYQARAEQLAQLPTTAAVNGAVPANASAKPQGQHGS